MIRVNRNSGLVGIPEFRKEKHKDEEGTVFSDFAFSGGGGV